MNPLRRTLGPAGQRRPAVIFIATVYLTVAAADVTADLAPIDHEDPPDPGAVGLVVMLAVAAWIATRP